MEGARTHSASPCLSCPSPFHRILGGIFALKATKKGAAYSSKEAALLVGPAFAPSIYSVVSRDSSRVTRMAQINARLSPRIRDRFDDYAAKLGLDAAELARLLIVRELRVRRILMSSNPQAPSKASTATGHRKLTAHFHRAEQVAEFDRYANAHGLSRAAAAKLIFERELRETWLAKAF